MSSVQDRLALVKVRLASIQDRLASIRDPTKLPTDYIQEETVVCDDSGQLFDSDTQASQNLQFETDHVAYRCIICEKAYMERSHLSEHVATAHPDDTLNGLKIADIRIFKCDTCSYSTSKKPLLLKHMRSHTGVRPHQCKVCKKSFTQVYNLKTHERQHSGNKPYVCNVCNKAFTTNGNLKSHANIHTGHKPIICNVCNESFAHKGNLNIHKRRYHTVQEKDAAEMACVRNDPLKHVVHRCKICDELFDTKIKLVYHKLNKHKSKIICSHWQCDKSFNSKGDLSKHVRSMHREEKMHKCLHCPKAFSTKAHVTRHLKTHSSYAPPEQQNDNGDGDDTDKK